MKSTKIDSTIQRELEKLLAQYPLVTTIVAQLHARGAQALLVGGAVRDLLMGLPVKDLDIEVHGLTLDELDDVLRQFGVVSMVGKAFGVLRLHGLDSDWSLPRTDQSGRKPVVSLDPHLPLKEAFARRDLTMNAMGIDLVTYELIDPFHGYDDIRAGILRTPNPTFFVEDPLRFYRVMQFIGRFAMQPDDELTAVCKSMDISGVSRERIETEFNKLLLKSENPSLGIRWVHSLGRLAELWPELGATVGVPQNPVWHPEGDVFEHTMQALDGGTRLSYTDVHEKLIIMYALLCHDLGKVDTTVEIDGIFKSPNHAQSSVVHARTLLARITHNHDIVDAVLKLVACHMEPGQFVSGNAQAAAYKRLARKLAPHVTLEMLAQLALADKRGRNPNSHEPLIVPIPDVDKFIEYAKQYAVLEHAEPPVLQGKDFLDHVAPGPQLGELVRLAYKLQIDEGITDKEELKQRVLSSVS
ncbi:MAG: CCA tRNA nucleotidyltransferase [Candidatus Babeliales bacterium]